MADLGRKAFGDSAGFAIIGGMVTFDNLCINCLLRRAGSTRHSHRVEAKVDKPRNRLTSTSSVRISAEGISIAYRFLRSYISLSVYSTCHKVYFPSKSASAGTATRPAHSTCRSFSPMNDSRSTLSCSVMRNPINVDKKARIV